MPESDMPQILVSQIAEFNQRLFEAKGALERHQQDIKYYESQIHKYETLIAQLKLSLDHDKLRSEITNLQGIIDRKSS